MTIRSCKFGAYTDNKKGTYRMCFSACASFGASAVLATTSILTLKKIQHGRYTLIALMPLIFAVQQAAEGIVWLTFTQFENPWVQTIASYFFLSIALGLWPVYAPLMMLHAEVIPSRKKMMNFILALGSAVSGILLWYLTHGATPQATCNHIAYDYTYQTQPWMIYVLTAAYLISTMVPFFISSIPHAWILGVLIGGAYGVSYFFYYHWLGSVWCFCAAVLSTISYAIVPKK